VAYKLDMAGHYTVLQSFTGGADGGYPYAGVIRLGRQPLRDHFTRWLSKCGRGVQVGYGRAGDGAA
jgi:hypothetical protein